MKQDAALHVDAQPFEQFPVIEESDHGILDAANGLPSLLT
jgi:hypothetical protein